MVALNSTYCTRNILRLVVTFFYQLTAFHNSSDNNQLQSQGSTSLMVAFTSLAVMVLQILSPLYVLLTTGSFFFLRPPQPPSPTPVVSVVVAARIPRRASILALSSLVALTYFFDGFVRVLYAVFDRRSVSNSAELNAVIGVAAFAGLAALGAWKDVHGVQVWFLRRLKVAITLALIFDLLLAIFLGISMRSSSGCRSWHIAFQI